MNPRDDRERLLARLRAAVAESRFPAAPSPGTEPPEIPGIPSAGELAERFRERFAAHGGVFFAGPSLEAISAALAEELKASGVSVLSVPEDDPHARRAAETLAPFGPFAIEPSGEPAGSGAPVCAGVQTAEFAVAETGSVVQTDRGGRTLLPGLLPEVHVALIPPEALVDRIEECLAALAHDPPRTISFLSGPSRTADIELTLTVGVHGPGKMVAVLLPPTTP